MPAQPTFQTPPAAQGDATTGRFIITFQDEAVTEGIAAMRKIAGIAKLPRGLTPLHELGLIVHLVGVAQRNIGLEDRIGGAAPWTTSPASVA